MLGLINSYSIPGFQLIYISYSSSADARSSAGVSLAPSFPLVGFVLCFLWAINEVDERQIAAVTAPELCTIKEKKQARTY